jgi:hypothetical protein
MQDYNQSYDQVQKVQIVDTTIKRAFKVVLDSNLGSSWSGSQFNATYTVDFKNVVREAWRLKKAYYMTFSFVSMAGTAAETGISNLEVYTLHIDMGKGQNIYRYNNIKVPSGIVRVDTIGTNILFNTKPTDNEPVLIDNLSDVTGITLNLISTTGNSTFVPGTAGAAGTRYVCILNLQEA